MNYEFITTSTVFSDPFLCLIYISTSSNYLKLFRYNFKVLHISVTAHIKNFGIKYVCLHVYDLPPYTHLNIGNFNGSFIITIRRKSKCSFHSCHIVI